MKYAIVMSRAAAVFSACPIESVEPRHLNLVRQFETLTELVEAAMQMSQDGWTQLPRVDPD